MEELILKERELKENLVNAMNESGLPAFILRSVLKDFLDTVDILEAQEYEKAKKIKKEESEVEKK